MEKESCEQLLYRKRFCTDFCTEIFSGFMHENKSKQLLNEFNVQRVCLLESTLLFLLTLFWAFLWLLTNHCRHKFYHSSTKRNLVTSQSYRGAKKEHHIFFRKVKMASEKGQNVVCGICRNILVTACVLNSMFLC